MLASQNVYLPITLLPSQTQTITLEDVAGVVPIFNGKVFLRNIDDLIPVSVTFSTVLNITDAPMAFVGNWPNTLVENTLPPEGMIVLTAPGNIDGRIVEHVVTLTNTSSVSNALLHFLLVGSYESISAQNIPTLAVLP